MVCVPKKYSCITNNICYTVNVIFIFSIHKQPVYENNAHVVCVTEGICLCSMIQIIQFLYPIQNFKNNQLMINIISFRCIFVKEWSDLKHLHFFILFIMSQIRTCGFQTFQFFCTCMRIKFQQLQFNCDTFFHITMIYSLTIVALSFFVFYKHCDSK